MDYLNRRYFSVPFLFLILCLLSSVSGDLRSDKQLLLAFVDAVHHPHKLNWNSNSSICSSWIGVTCTADQTHVHALRLPAVGLSGPIPANTLGKLDALQVLSLRSNHLTGNLPSDIISLPSLQNLYLQHNNFSGDIPASFSLGLTSIDLSYNSFTGEIPVGIQNLSQLSVLNLQNNSLSGPIPDLKHLRLKHLNMSYNHLNGSIPFSLQKFPNDSFLGNPQLCGPPLSQCSAVLPSPSPSPFSPSLLLPPAPSQNHKKSSGKNSSAGLIIAIAVGGLALLLLLVMVLFICILRRKDGKGNRGLKENGSTIEMLKEEYSSGVQMAEKNKLVFLEGCAYNFDLEDLLRASAEVLGKGSYGTAYKAVLEDGTTVVVKRLKEVVVGKREFEHQMEIIGRVGQHPKLVPLRAYFYSKDEKLLVYDYVPTGSFCTLLHGMPL